MEDYLKALTNAVAIEMHMGWGRWNLQCCILSRVSFREKTTEDERRFKTKRYGGHGVFLNI